MPPRTHTRWCMRAYNNGLVELLLDGEAVITSNDPNILLSLFGEIAGGQG